MRSGATGQCIPRAGAGPCHAPAREEPAPGFTKNLCFEDKMSHGAAGCSSPAHPVVLAFPLVFPSQGAAWDEGWVHTAALTSANKQQVIHAAGLPGWPQTQIFLLLLLSPPWRDVRHPRVQVQPGSPWFVPRSPGEGSCLAPALTRKKCGLSLARGALTCPLSPCHCPSAVSGLPTAQLSPPAFSGGKNILAVNY